MLPVRLRSKGEGEVVSVHSGTIGGDVGGRYVSLHVLVVHCDGCERTHCDPSVIDEGAALDFAIRDGWDCDEDDGDFCPECKAKVSRAEASR